MVQRRRARVYPCRRPSYSPERDRLCFVIFFFAWEGSAFSLVEGLDEAAALSALTTTDFLLGTGIGQREWE